MVNKTYNIALDLRKVTAQPLAIPPLVEGDNGNILVITLTNDGVPVSLQDCKVLCVFSKTSDGSTVEQDTEDAVVDLLDYGITYTGTPSANDTITITTTAGVPGTPVCTTGSATLNTAKFLEMFPDDGTYVFKYHSDWQYGDNSVVISGTSHNIITVNLKTGSFGAGKNNCELQIYSGTNNEVLITSAQFNFDSRKGIMNEDTIASEEKYPILVSILKVVQSLKTRLESLLPKWEGATATATRTENSVSVTLNETSGHKSFDFLIPTDVHIGTSAPTGQQSVWIRPDGVASGYVPTSRKINGYDLSADRTLDADDIPTDTANVSVQDSIDATASSISTINTNVYNLSTRIDNMVRMGTVAFTVAGWSAVSGTADVYEQTPTITVTPVTTNNTKVDLQTTHAQILQLLDDGVSALYVENDNNTFKIYCVGDLPTVAMTLQAQFTEI